MGAYIVKPNDTLSAIAKANNTTVDALVKQNGILNPNRITVGQVIEIPKIETGTPVVDQSRKDLYTPTETASTSIASSVPSTPNYDATSWDDTTKGQAAWKDYTDAKDKVTGYEDFTYKNQEKLDAIMDSILNREKFSYNFNEDAFYQMYKDKYTKQGKMAMADVMGQAAAMTGGYGNSYAATVGNQAYQASLDNLNDIIPELYQMAYDRYNQEEQSLYNKYGLLNSDYERAYGEYSDKYNKLMDILGITKSDYYDGADLYYSDLSNKNSIASQSYNDAMAKYEAEQEAARYAEEIAYQQERDKVADNQWQAEYDAKYGSKSTDADDDKPYTAPQGSETPKSSTNLMDFNRDQYSKNVQEHGGSYYGTVLEDLKEMKENGASNKTAQTYLAELVANSLITGSEYSNLYNQYRDNKLK